MYDSPLYRKAQQAQLLFQDLTGQIGLAPIPTTFIADEGRKAQFARACLRANPFPGPVAAVLLSKRVPGVAKLFREEAVLQTPAIAAVLAACSSAATQIARLRGLPAENAHTYCDVAFAGLQAIRLYMADYQGKDFRSARLRSAVRVDNAFNGSFYKYRARDGRDISMHVYYQDQQRKLAAALPLKKPYTDYNMGSLPLDKRELAAIFAREDALHWEELAFAAGACGCMIRSREEWEQSEVGKAVCAMPLIGQYKEAEAPAPQWGLPGKRGPLAGLKVLDLTHIIAGPACSRILAEYGADVLMIRRGSYLEQEQAMLELDGWAGKHAIHLDFNIPEQLEKAKELIRQADVVTCSYQDGALDRFGLSIADIRALNPRVVYSHLMCFSDSVWRQRPGWAPCAEDITGLSVRNGSPEKPVNLNGVPLDYFPGFLLALGTLMALIRQLQEGGGYRVVTSLTRGAQYLHECTDRCQGAELGHDGIATHCDQPLWDSLWQYVPGCATGGRVGFPSPGTINTAFPLRPENLWFTDGNTGWKQF